MKGLISAAALEALVAGGNACLVDIRLPTDGGRPAFIEGHVPGAVFSDYGADGWRQREGQVPGLLPPPDHLSALFARLGITPGRPVVLIPLGRNANDFAAAARAYWTLKLAGHRDLAILDGGTLGWAKSGRALATGDQLPDPAPPYPLAWQPALRIRPEAILAALPDNPVLVDARSAAYFAGDEKAPEARMAGHIPGALSIDYALSFDPATHGLQPREMLEARFAVLPASDQLITYCNTGHTAALNWFVLSEILGRETRLYDGSMTEWTQDPARPVATGGG